MYTALRATSRTLAKFLETKFQADPLLSGFFGGGMVVSLATPQEMNEKPAEGLSVWLYRIIRDEQRLNDPPVRISVSELQPLFAQVPPPRNSSASPVPRAVAGWPMVATTVTAVISRYQLSELSAVTLSRDVRAR